MEERDYGINWLGLFIKVIAFVVIILLAIWLISKITLKNKGLSFEANNKLYQEAVVEYFKKNLPEEEKSGTVTLKQLIRLNYLEELKNEKGKTCDLEKTKSKIEIVDDYYSIKTTLVCDSKSKTEYIKLGNEKCTDCDIKIKGLEIKKEQDSEEKSTNEETTNQNNNNSNLANNNTTTTNKKVLYEYVKYNTEYTEWYVGKVTGNNIENSKQKVTYGKYCKIEEFNYYTVSYVTTNSNNMYTYTLELKAMNNIDNLKITADNYFGNISDYRNYINKRNKELEMTGSLTKYQINITDPYDLREASLKKNNFTYSIGKPYKSNGKYYVDITVRIKNLTGVVPYKSTSGISAYFVPIKFSGSYADLNGCITDKTANSTNYANYLEIDTWNEYLDVYRYKITIPEYIYSSATSLEGYTKTGKTKLAS